MRNVFVREVEMEVSQYDSLSIQNNLCRRQRSGADYLTRMYTVAAIKYINLWGPLSLDTCTLKKKKKLLQTNIQRQEPLLSLKSAATGHCGDCRLGVLNAFLT